MGQKKIKLSCRSATIIQSEIRNMSVECDRIDGINLSQGICNLELPRSVAEGAKKAIDGGLNYYTRYDGLPELRKALTKKLLKYNKIKADPEKNIIVSAGATGAFYCTCLALLDPGDEVIIFEPFYGYHVNTLLAVGARPAYAKLRGPGWVFDIKELQKLITSKTKGIMINTPANPSGKVFSRVELKELAGFVIKNNLIVFTDEIYEYLVYDGLKHISPGSLPEIADRTITISGYSKTYSITGWRIGYAVCHEKWAQMIGYINDLVYVCGPAPLQMGVAKGIRELTDKFYKSLAKEYLKKRNIICAALKKAGLAPFVPQGSYYVLADASNLPGKTSKEKAMYLLKKTGVASVPGAAFYSNSGGENLLRFCFAKDEAELKAACQRLKKLKL